MQAHRNLLFSTPRHGWRVTLNFPSGLLHHSCSRNNLTFCWKELWLKLDLQDIVGLEASKRFQLQDMRMPLDNASIQRLLTPPVEVGGFGECLEDGLPGRLLSG